MLLYRSPPGDLATVLAFGREYQVGTWLGPPLAFWLADIAFRAAGNHMFGVYLLAQALRRRHLLDLLSAGPRHRRRPAGGARGAALDDGGGVQFARRRVRPAGAGAPAMGAAAAAFLAIDRPEPAQRLVRLVDRGRAVAADDVGGARVAAAARRICRCHRARPARADVARSALCAAGDRRPGVALSDLAAPRRRTRACRRGPRSPISARAPCIGAGCSAAWCSRCPPSCCWRSSIPAGSPAMPRKRRSSTGRRSIRWRATSSISSPSPRRCSEVPGRGLFNLDRVVGRRRRCAC